MRALCIAGCFPSQQITPSSVTPPSVETFSVAVPWPASKRSVLFGSKPLVVNSIIAAVLAQRQQHDIDLPQQQTIGWKYDAVILFVKRLANHLHPSFTSVRGVIKEHRCIEHDGINLLVKQRLVGIIHIFELARLGLEVA